MKRYTVSQARERLAGILDAAESGERVVIERRGVRFVLVTDTPGTTRTKPAESLIAAVDEAVADGNWTWVPGSGGVKFIGRRRRL